MGEWDFLKLLAWERGGGEVSFQFTQGEHDLGGLKIYLLGESNFQPKKCLFQKILHFNFISCFAWQVHFTLPGISLSIDLILQTQLLISVCFWKNKSWLKFQIY